MITRETAGFTTEQEEHKTSTTTTTATDNKISSKVALSSSASSWSRLKDPRIVRVPRAFGGKDRHSKVSTVRGLRDRRVRLSVPTAIQLYDLQDRLGLNQPSKVVDWLLNAAKDEIDELPPLQMPTGGNFGVHHHQVPFLVNSQHGADKQGLKMNIGGSTLNWDNDEQLEPSVRSSYWGSTSSDPSKSNKFTKEMARDERKEGKQQQQEDFELGQMSNFFPRPNSIHQQQPSSLPGSNNLLNNVMPAAINSFVRWDPSNLSLSQLTPQPHQDLHNFNVVPFSMPSGSQVLIYPPGITQTQSYFPSHTGSIGEFDPKQINFQMLSSGSQIPFSNSPGIPPLYAISQAMKPLHLSMSTGSHEPFPSHDSSGNQNQPNKDD